MVSELSARLLRGFNLSPTFATSNGSKGPGSSSSSSDTGSTDEEPASSRTSNETGNTSLSTLSNGKKQVVGTKQARDSSRQWDSSRDGCFKRRRVDELQFAASRVEADLKRGGLPFPTVDTTQQRVCIDGFDIDMSNVNLLGSKKVAESPFLTKICTSSAYGAGSMNLIDQLFSATHSSYSKRSNSGSKLPRSDWGNSSDGSLTSDSESADGLLDIPPLLEDALKPRSCNKARVAMEIVSSTMPKEKPMTMRAALESCNEPRLLTLSFAPFLVVHANDAYTRMTGLTAMDVLGKPVQEIFQDHRCRSMAAKASSLQGLDNQLTTMVLSKKQRSFEDNAECRLGISLVGPDTTPTDVDAHMVTHFLLGLKSTKINRRTNNASPSMRIGSANELVPVSSSFSMHCGVMG